MRDYEPPVFLPAHGPVLQTNRDELRLASEKLARAVSDFQATGRRVSALLAGADALPFSEATARVSQAARLASAEALLVKSTAEAAEEAAESALQMKNFKIGGLALALAGCAMVYLVFMGWLDRLGFI